MNDIIRMVLPDDELPDWLANYASDSHQAEVTLKDIQHLAERINREHTATIAWASNTGGGLSLMLCGRGMRCKHQIAVGKRDAFTAILHRVDEAVNQHIDDCLGRSKSKTTKTRQLALFA